MAKRPCFAAFAPVERKSATEVQSNISARAAPSDRIFLAARRGSRATRRPQAQAFADARRWPERRLEPADATARRGRLSSPSARRQRGGSRGFDELARLRSTDNGLRASRSFSRKCPEFDTPVVADHFPRESVRLVRSCKKTQFPAGSRYCPGRRKLGESHEMSHRDYRSLGSERNAMLGLVYCRPRCSLWKSVFAVEKSRAISPSRRRRRPFFSTARLRVAATTRPAFPTATANAKAAA